MEFIQRAGKLRPQASFSRFWWGFVYLLLLMNFWRIIFLFSQAEFIETVNWRMYLRSFSIGFRLDAVVASYLVIPIGLLLILKAFKMREEIFKRISYVYFFLVSLLISLVNIVDIFIFREFNAHVNFLTISSYVVQEDSMSFIFEEYPIFLAVLFLLILAWLGSSLYAYVRNGIAEKPATMITGISGVFVSILVLGTSIRGGWQERPIDWGHAMFSQDFISNQTALNPLFFFGRSYIQFSSENSAMNLLDFYDDTEAFQLTRSMLETPGAEFLNDESMLRRNDSNAEKPYNIILVILESHTGAFTGYIRGDTASITPNLDRMANQGIAFTNCYANGKRSAHGISSILMSWPNLPGLPLISRMESVNKVPSLGTSLQGIGYETIFMYGGDAQFDNMKGFVIANGFNRVIERNDFPGSQTGTKWGIYDHLVLDHTLEVLDQASEPVFLTLFTTTNHQPWKIPQSYEQHLPTISDTLYHRGEIHRSMSYVDRALGEFMDKASEKDWYNNSIFVFIADHGLSVVRDQLEGIRNAHIPFVIYAPGLQLEPRRIDLPVSQVDVTPTLLGLIDYTKPYTFFGQDALASESGLACRITVDQAFWVEDNYLYVEMLGQDAKLYRVTCPIDNTAELVSPDMPEFKHYQKNFRSYLQTGATQFSRFSGSSDKN